MRAGLTRWTGLSWLADGLLAESGRWILWFPVLAGVGIGLYFGLDREPAIWVGPVALGIALLMAVLVQVRRPEWGLAAWILLLALPLGFTAAQGRTTLVAAPVMRADLGPTVVTGRVERIDRLESGLRLILIDLSIRGLPPADTPERIRASLRNVQVAPAIGERVRLFARVGPAGEPAEPGAFDLRRHLYFQGIGGTGFVLGPAKRLALAPEDDLSLEHWRQVIAERAAARLPDPAVASMVAALLNGQPGAIPEEDMVAMRQSGLQHLLSISGLHIALVAGLVFFLLRGGMALWPAFALRHPIKKYAAVAALAVSVFYMLMVGSPVPTQRSVLMTGVMLLAVLVDRNPFSMRVVALAALAVILVQPESMVGPSFQMSFAAVIALIAAFELVTPWMAARRREGGQGLVGRGLTYVGSLSLTSLVAGLASIPFGLHHFQQMSNYGLLANMIAVPVTSFWVMPWGLVVYLLMPLGWDGWALTAMGWGAEAILWTAHWVADMPGAAITLPLLPAAGLVVFTLSGLWLCLWRGRVRLLGVVGMLTGLLFLPLSFRPDLRINAEGKVVGVRLADGGLAVSTRVAGRFDSDEWAQRDGLPDPPQRWPKTGTRDGRLTCASPDICLYSLNGSRVAIALAKTSVPQACASGADALVTRWLVADCAVPLVIDAGQLADKGAHALYLRKEGIGLETVRVAAGARPWG
ncbi:ComEC/Rec2 family competence protein [Niveispirillum sp. KHB5.9]|uniref:ComEC/Rec2 family competence protein n=1 Tax=Niveispirillum sp. KHB5.9 TaxID=3400269 RepID=UPI003A87C535